MDIVIKGTHGKLYKLEYKANSTPGTSSPKHTDPFLNSPRFDQTQPHAPNSWKELWRQLKIKHPSLPMLQQEKDILKQLQTYAGKKLVLRAFGNSAHLSHGRGSAAGGNGNNDTSQKQSNNSGGSSLGPARGDKRIEPAPASTSPHSEKGATCNSEPAKDGDQAIENMECSGDPVSMISGEEVLHLQDFSLPGPMSFTWQRTYRSSHTRNIGLGVGWSHSGSEYLEIGDFKTQYIDCEGRSIPFNTPKIKQRSKYIPEQLTLDRISDNCFILKKQGEYDKVFRRDNNALSRLNLVQLRHPGFCPAEPSANKAETGFAINFSHNEQNRLTRVVGNWGKSLQIARDQHGRIISINLNNEIKESYFKKAEYDYDKDNNLIAHRNAKGSGEKYRYENHLLKQRTLATGFNFYFDWDGEGSTARCIHNWGDNGIYEYYFDWDNQNNRSLTTDSRGFQTEYFYNDYGQITKQVDNEKGVHLYEYDNGRKTAYVNPEGHKTQFFFDAENNPAGTKDALGHSVSIGYFNGKPTTFVDKDKTHWRREYNRNGQLIRISDPYNQNTNYTYNKNGLLASSTDAMARTTRYLWSAHGDLAKIVDPRGHTRQFSYDDQGNITRVEFLIDGKTSAGATQYFYNPTGKIEKIIAPNGDISTYSYNENDQLIRFSDARGRTTEFKYDGLSQVVERIDAEGQKLKYEYDTERNLTALTNENGERYAFFYDGNERLIKEIGFDGRTQHYKYNKAGHLIKHLDAEQFVTEFERDALGQLITKSIAAVNKNMPPEKTRYQYDAKGRLIETYNQTQYLAFEYNHFGNLIKEHHSDINEQNKRIKSSMVDIGFSNIWPGIRSGIQLPDGQNIEYEFDDNNLLQNVMFNGSIITELERDEFGRETARHQGDLATTRQYDPLGRLQKQASFNKKLKAQGPVNRAYNYDEFGNLSQLIDGNYEARFVYDLVNRLEKVEGTLPEKFSFDPASNLVSSDGSPISKSEGNRLAFQADRHFTYDERGNLIQENRGKGGKIAKCFFYNLQNQLIKVEQPGQTTEYKYDPLGRRVEKKDNFGITRYLWTGDQLAQETRNNIKKTYIYEPETFRPVAMVQDGEIYHYHLDHLGTPKELSNNSGEVVWRVQYKTYGNVAVKEIEEVENNLRFQGQYFDEETGLHYNRHRYYDPGTGQFTTQDPIGLLGGVNNYQYAPNPITWLDPYGLKCKEGYAIVRQLENGYQEGHLTVEVVFDDVNYATDQVITSPDRSTTTIRRYGKINSDAIKNGTVAHEVRIALPDAEAALEYQKKIRNTELGKYDLIENSCYSHVFDVLEAGGHPPIQRSKRGFFKFMKSNGFGRIEDAPSLEA